MTKPIKWDAPPSLAVIDEAIARIKDGRNHFTCVALADAYMAVEDTETTDFPVSLRRSKLYRDQYANAVFTKEVSLTWWSSAMSHKRQRIAALKKFKRACIDAAKKEQA